MPTLCELKIEAKKRGLKGYSKLKKTELEAMLSTKEQKPRDKPSKKTKLNIKRPDNLKQFKVQEIPKFKKKETPKKKKLNIVAPLAKTFDEFLDLQFEEVDDMLSGITDFTIEKLVRGGAKQNTEAQMLKLFERGSRVAFRDLKSLFKEAKKNAKTNKDILANLKKLYNE